DGIRVYHVTGVQTCALPICAQAIAAMAYGTASIPKVDKLFGPGNQYVTMAKSLVQTTANVSIDMPAGPSEVLVIADRSSNPDYEIGRATSRERVNIPENAHS